MKRFLLYMLAGFLIWDFFSDDEVADIIDEIYDDRTAD